MGFEPLTPCVQALALTIRATETWLTVSPNQRHLLIEKALRATRKVEDATCLKQHLASHNC